MSLSRKIAVQDLSMAGWQAGAVVSRTLAASLALAGERVVYLHPEGANIPAGVEGCVVPAVRHWPGETTWRRWRGLEARSGIPRILKKEGIGGLCPVVKPPGFRSPGVVGWIPDFQHKFLPERFGAGQIAELDGRFEALGRESRLVWFSSEDAAGHFRRFYPRWGEKARVASFPSLFALEKPEGDARTTLTEYGLPKKFLLVINQFWGHKNHRVVARALGILRGRGRRIPAVLAGLPSDYRDRANTAVSETLQLLAKGGVWEDVRVLGGVSRAELTALLRSATLLAQPSRFEGWNTSVEDAKALGCPVVVSDLPVHREQCPEAVGFFDCDAPEKLADILEEKWDELSARPEEASERAALEAAQGRALEFGRRMAEICREAQA